MEHTETQKVAALRTRIARLQAVGRMRRDQAAIGFAIPAIDYSLPNNSLGNALHEVAGTGAETEHGSAAALFIAGLLAQRTGPVLWVQERCDLYPPALLGAGLPPERVIYVAAGRDVLTAMEDGLRCRSLAGMVGETSARVTLTVSRRLQLAAETLGVPAFLLRRSRRFDDPRLAEPNAAATRWRVTSLPAPPPLPEAPAVPGLGRPLWRLDLIRCRGGEPATWIVEAADAQGHLRLVSDLADRPAAAERRRAVGESAVHHRYT